MNTSIPQDSSTTAGTSVLRATVLRLSLSLFILGGFVSGIVGLVHFTSLSRALINVALDPPIFSPFSRFPRQKSENVPDWRNKERVTVLVLGVDRRLHESRDDPVRTDTMMLVTVDPSTQTAGLLSIPRDLLVPIPMPSKDCQYLPWGNPYGQERVNSAYVFGQLCKYPTGGAGLAKETVQYNFGVKVHYYVLIDFDAFEALIDAVGGVDIDVPQRLVDYNYPTSDYGIMRIEIPAGPQQLDGEKALWYVRSRHMDSDFGRMHRQQQLLLALREKLLQLGMLPRLPQLALEFRDAVRTDLSNLEAASLLLSAREIDSASIVHRTLEFPYVTSMTGADGASYQVPMRDRIREVIREVFGDPRLQQENATVEVLNGTSVSGLAGRIAQILKDRGILNVMTGNAPDGQSRRSTEVVTYTSKDQTAARIAEALGLPKPRIKAASALEQGPDIRVLVGEDLRDR